MKANKSLVFLLVFAILQVSSIFVESVYILIAYVVSYLNAITFACIQIVKTYKLNRSFKPLASSILHFTIVNLVLQLVYFFTLHLNPAINWMGEGRAEGDPMILMVFFPIVQFFLAIPVLLTVAGIVKLSVRSN